MVAIVPERSAEMLQIILKRSRACQCKLQRMNAAEEFVVISPEILYF